MNLRRELSRAADWAGPASAFCCLVTVLAFGRGCSSGKPAVEQADAAAPAAPAVAPAASVEWNDEEVPKGNLAFEVVDAATHLPIPCKLTFVGVGPTPSPKLTHREVPVAIDGGIAAFDRVFSLQGHGGLALPHGSYDVYVSRGPEWSVDVERGVRVSKTPVRVVAKLEHLVPTPGWVSADLHVHAAPSWDSVVPLSARVEEFAAEGVDVLVATDHNVVSDYRPEIARLGAKDLLGTVSGAELSTMDWGHFGAFPMRPEPDWRLLHGTRVQGMSARIVIETTRKRDPDALITVNHPRLGLIGYFTRAGFLRSSASFVKVGASLDFDALEVMNGYQGAQIEQVDTVLNDWFALLLHGRKCTAVGNSDTHHTHYAIAGYPRNYVKLADDRVGSTDPDALADGLRAGRAFFTTGPMLDVDVDGYGLGALVPAHGHPVTLHVRVRAAPWVSVSQVRVLVDGTLAQLFPVAESNAVERFRGELPLTVERDHFVVVEASGKEPLGPVVRAPSGRPMPAYALSNPIFLDADENGRYDAPL